jgi:hypothetical protein
MHPEYVVNSNIIQPNITVPFTLTHIRVSDTLYTESAVPAKPGRNHEGKILMPHGMLDEVIRYMGDGQVPLLIRLAAYTTRPPCSVCLYGKFNNLRIIIIKLFDKNLVLG